MFITRTYVLQQKCIMFIETICVPIAYRGAFGELLKRPFAQMVPKKGWPKIDFKLTYFIVQF